MNPPPPPAERFASRLFAGPALRTQSDRRLVTLVREGYESAFEEIVRRYAKPLGRYAAGIVGSRSEDVTQDAFSKALLALRKDSEVDIELRPWLYRIVRNTALNDLRDGPPAAVELIEPLEGGTPSAAEELERRQELEELLERLRALPDPQRAAIVMRELEGLGHEEIANSLGISGGGARQAIFRARQALRDGLGFLIPLPLMKTLLEHGAGAETGIAAGGAALGAAGAAGGAGTALKVGVVTAVLAGSVGTGLAVKDRPQDRDAETAAAATVPIDRSSGSTSSSGNGSGDSSNAFAAGSGERETERGEDSSGPGGGEDRDRSLGDGDDFDSSGPGSGRDDDGPDRDDGRQSDDGPRHGGGPGPSDGGGGSSGPGGGGTSGQSGDDRHGGSGSGTSGSGSGTSGSGSGASGSGSGSYLPPPPPPDDSSSSGHGSGGSFDSDSSGSGSGGDDIDSSGSGSGVEGPVAPVP